MGTLVGTKGLNNGGGQLIRNKGKGSVEECLPSRFVVSELTRGDPSKRTAGEYEKVKSPTTPGTAMRTMPPGPVPCSCPGCKGMKPHPDMACDECGMVYGTNNRTYADKW